MRIAVMGAGGVGAYVGARLQAAGEDLSYVARGAHLKALQRDGLRLEGPLGELHLPLVMATDDPAQIGPVDLVLFTVKLWDTDAAARALPPLLKPATRVLTLQNGIDSVELIARHVPRAQVLGGVIYLSAVISRPGVVTSPGGLHRIVADGAGGNEVVAAFCAACARATSIEASVAEPIERTIWEKFIVLASISAATALLRAPIGRILGHPETRAFLRQLIDEGVAVACAGGQPIPAAFTDAALERSAGLPPTMRASMAEDLERGRPLELEWLSGRVHRLGLERGVPTPAHTAAYRGLVLHAQGAA